MFSWICCNLQWTIALRMIGKSTNFSDRHTAPLLFSVDPLLTKKRVDRKKMTIDQKFFLSKTVRFVWNNSYVGACVLVITAWWLNAKFYFSVNRKIWLRNEKIFNLQLTKGIIDQKFPTFYVPIYPYKMYIFYCYETFCQELAGKSSPSCPRF